VSVENNSLIDWLEHTTQKLETCAHEKQPFYRFFQGDGVLQAEMTHREVLVCAKSLAAFIQTKVSFGDRVLLLYPSGLDYVIAFYACLYAGVIAVPAFPPDSRRRNIGRIDAIFENAHPALVLCTTSLQENISQWLTELNLSHPVSVYASDQLQENDVNEWQRPASHANSIAFLQYSSGSTGTPKGVMVTHTNILHNLHIIADGFSLGPQESVASWLPMYHDMGLIGSVLEPMKRGVDIYLMSPMDVIQKPARWLQLISDHKVTASGGPNFIYEHCVKRVSEEEKATLDLSSWRLAVNGAEPIRKNTLDCFSRTFESCGFNATSHTACYGMAETTLMVSSADRKELYSSLEQNLPGNNFPVVCSGYVHPDFSVKIVNPDTKIECRDDQVGEIWLQGESVAKGYWQQEELTQQIFHAKLLGESDEYLRTGDLGFKQDKALYVTGRIKELIIIRGENHYPQDIEASVSGSCEELSGSYGAAFSVDVNGVEQLVVVHEVNRQLMRHLNVEKVLTDVRRAVSENHQLQIQSVVFIKPASLLRTTSGKIRRVSMRDAFLNGELKEVYRWPQKQKEDETSVRKPELIKQIDFDQASDKESLLIDWIQNWISARLHIPLSDITPSESFVSFGLDSVDGVELSHAISQAFDINVEADLAWAYPNISEASAYLIMILENNIKNSTLVQEEPVEDKWLEGEI